MRSRASKTGVTKLELRDQKNLRSRRPDLKVNPDRVVKHAVEAHRPVLLTSRGHGVAVMQSLSDYEQAAEERDFMRAVVAGLADLDAGREVSLPEAKARFGLE